MSTIVTAMQQSVGMLNHKVGQDIPNRMRMLSPQTNQDQMCQNQITYQGHTQQVVLALARITIIITQRKFLVRMISRMCMMLMERNIKICRKKNYFLNDSFIVLFTIIRLPKHLRSDFIF